MLLFPVYVIPLNFMIDVVAVVYTMTDAVLRRALVDWSVG